jgi:hypothetical protein
MNVTREKLYEEVWAEPMTTVAKRYDVASGYLASVCEQLNVPRPPRGYWQQLKVGRAPKKPKLPDPRPGDDLEWVRDGGRPRWPSVPRTPVLPKRPKKSERPARHPLLVGALEHFLHSRVSTYDTEKYLRPYKRNLVDVHCSKESLKLALATASALFLAIEERGHRVILAPSDERYSRMGLSHREGEKLDDDNYRYWHRRGPAKPTLVFVDTVAIGLSIFEVSEEVEVRYIGGEPGYARVGSPEDRAAPRRSHDWTTKQWLVSGRLGVHAYAPYSAIRWERYWHEKKPGELTSLLESIAKELEAGAQSIVKLLKKEEREAEERRKKQAIEHREWERKEAERRRIEREAAREKEIVATIGQWRLARDIRAYVADIQALVEGAGFEITKGSNAEEELKWALAHADRVDPLTEWRKDIESVKAEMEGKPCPKCGEIHDGHGAQQSGEAEAPPPGHVEGPVTTDVSLQEVAGGADENSVRSADTP